MKSLIARWLGYDKRLAEVEAQRDATAESLLNATRAANIHAIRTKRLVELLEVRDEVQDQAATLIRQAHRQMNLKGGVAGAQRKILEAAHLLESRD